MKNIILRLGLLIILGCGIVAQSGEKSQNIKLDYSFQSEGREGIFILSPIPDEVNCISKEKDGHKYLDCGNIQMHMYIIPDTEEEQAPDQKGDITGKEPEMEHI